MDPEREVMELLKSLLEGVAAGDECRGWAEDLGITPRTRLSTFEEMGVSRGAGLVWKHPAGGRVYLTIQVQ